MLLHGSTASAATWWRVAPELARRMGRVVALDLPGHGKTPSGGWTISVEMVADRVADALARTLDSELPIDVLVGHSFGAMVALQLAATHSHLLTRLVLEELPGATSVDWIAEAESVAAAADSARSEPSVVLDAMRRDQPRWHELDRIGAVGALARCDAANIARGLRLAAAWDPIRVARRVNHPTLMLLAPDAAGVNRLEDATVLRGVERERLVRALGSVDVRLIDAGHCIHRDDPSAWLEAVRTFADRGSARKPE